MLTLEVTAGNASLEEPIAVPLARLLVSSSRGDERAFAELYDRTSSRVYGLVMQVLRDPAQADEVTQEVYLQAWQRAATYRREVAPVLTWLLTIAHRRAVDRVRHSQATRTRDDRDALQRAAQFDDNVGEQAERHLDILRVRQALRQLSDSQRQAVILAHIAGYTHTEIAELLSLPLGTVKSRTRDGLQRLRIALSEPTTNAG